MSDKRTQMPECAKFVDEMRAIFGRELGGHAIENGIEVTWGNWVQRRFVAVVMPVRERVGKVMSYAEFKKEVK